MVGDIFRLEFDLEWIEAPLVFGRCLRCRLVREDVFETGFKFFNPVDLTNRKKVVKEDDLLD